MSRPQASRQKPFFVSCFIWLILSTAFPFSISIAAQNNIPDWAKLARIAGFDADPDMSDQEISDLMGLRQTENVAVLEVDSGLSNYMNDTQFQKQIDFLDKIATTAHSRNMRAVVYYPSLEVTTPNGESSPNSMYKDHPDWIQQGIDGSPNVFYGSQEVWVEPGMESAWMSPNTGYRDYFLNRVRQLAATNLDGIWVDVPIYLGTGALWSGAEPAAATEFNAWTIANNLGGNSGYQTPTSVNWNDPVFRTWVRWRHENLADFIDAIRAAAHEINPNFMVIIENFPTDYMDATEAGLDGTYRRSNQNLLRVWEIDSVSNTKAMAWASIDEFSNKLTMYKWARAVDRENPSWAFSYGSTPLDAGLTLGAAVTTGIAPFESQTPEMTLTVDSEFRSRWFGFIRDHQKALLDTPRSASVGIWYSSPTRDYQDYKIGGGYGMYAATTNPNNDPDWWATEPGDSALPKPHLGGYRGAAHALTKLHIPFRIIADPGSPTTELAKTKFLWLPSVAAISNAEANIIKNFVSAGGIVFATGELPGTLDEQGNTRSISIFQDLFDFSGPGESVNFFGNGIAVYNPTIKGSDMFASISNPNKAKQDLSSVEQLVRIHVPDEFIVNAPDGIHVEIGKESETKHYLYVLNYSGLKQPVQSSLQNIKIDYRAPNGYRVVSATAYTPDNAGQSGNIAIQKSANHFYQMDLTVDQFTLISLTLASETSSAAPAWIAPVWSTPNRQEAAESAMNFILNSMRHSNAPEPMKFGIYTNLINDAGLTEIYAHGHHVTAEHMGLMLRASACMGNTQAFQQSYRFIDELMTDPLYHIVNWAIDRDRFKPLVELDDVWKNSNAPLDDFRVIRGLLAGSSLNMSDSEQLANKLLTGIYWTSITDRGHTTPLEFPAYPNGLVGYAWDWSGTTDSSLNPAAKATGIGGLTTDPIPTDYNDLYMLGQAAKQHPRWKPVLQSSTDLLLNSELTGVPGLFYNGYEANGNWTGDFENRDTNQGKHLKVIQTLWIALHLAAASDLEPTILDESRRTLARTAANRSLDFFKTFYTAQNRIPEYLTFNGNDVASCTGTNIPDGCLIPETENLLNGEARIYALLARLAFLLDDSSFAATLIEDKILTDRITDPSDPRYGLIGASTTSAGDAEAWNVLESVLTLCLEAKQGNLATGQAPVATSQTLNVQQDRSISIHLTASDPNQDPLTYQITSQPSSGSLSGTAPDLVYMPNSGYSGTDSFTFKANDGTFDSNTAVISLSISPITPVNNAPVANDQSVTTHQDTLITILLTASDQDGDLLSYEVLGNPTHGTLSGTAPNLTYAPNSGYSGPDQLSFRVNDGVLNSEIATVNITVQSTNNNGIISNLVTSITTDGNLADWAGLQSFGTDPDDVSGANNKLDWREGWLAHDANNIYLAYRNDGAIDQDNWWGWQIYIDTDNNPNTGYRLNDGIGAEIHIEENMVRTYTGDGDNWAWQDLGAASFGILNNIVELKFSRGWLGNINNFHLVFYGENIAFPGGTTEDYYPDGASNNQASVRFFQYGF